METFYKVLIVEKQEQMVHIYRNMLPWEDYQFQITTITDNEDRALAYFGEYTYELIITDIDLQSGNGISLMRQLKQLDANCHMIVISNHEDYDSVREAFRAGADEYLLKSRLRYSTLASALQEISLKIKEQQGSNDEPDWQEKIERMLGLIRDQQKIDNQVLLELLVRPELSLLNDAYRMLYFRMDNVRIFNRTMKQYDKPTWMTTDEFIHMFRNKLVIRDEMQMKLRGIVEEVFADVSKHELVFTKKHSGLVIVPPLEKELLKEKLRLLTQRIEEILTYQFSCTISRTGNSLTEFLPLYQETIEYHHHKFYDGDQCLEDVEEKKVYTSLQLMDIHYHEQIVKAIAMQEFDDILTLCNEAVDYMISHQIDPKEVREYFEMMIEHIEIMIKSKQLRKEYPFEVLRQGIQETEGIEYLRLELDKIFKTIMDWVKQGGMSRYQRKVDQMIQYIEEHLDQKITLAKVAEAVALSEIHAGRIFKKETGQGVIEYVNTRKMHLAVEYMKNKKLKIKEIAERVGIEDQFYFHRVFKKTYGISPREYRKQV